jgi:hypothetical protein
VVVIFFNLFFFVIGFVKISFWETHEQDENSLQSLLEKNPPDIKAIVESPEVIQSFRIKEESLMKVLLDKTNFLKLLELVFKSTDVKTSKKAFELFRANSPLLPFLLEDQQLCERCIAYIQNSTDDLRIGFATRLFIICFKEAKEKTLQIFNSSAQILPILFTNSQHRAVLELLDSYAQEAPIEGCWFIWSAILLCANKECSQCPDVWKSAPCAKLASVINSTKALDIIQKQQLVTMISNFTENVLLNDQDETKMQIMERLSHFTPTLVSTESLTEHALKFALILPVVDKELILIAKKLSLAPLPSTNISVLALKILTKFATRPESYAVEDVFQQLSSKFIADAKNSIFLVEFISFIKAACEGNASVYEKTSEMFGPYILENAKKENWRSSSKFVGFLLQIAEIIDEKQTSDEWVSFRQNELALWKERESETPKDTFESTGLSLAQRMAQAEDGITPVQKPQEPKSAPVAVQSPAPTAAPNIQIVTEAPKDVETKPEPKVTNATANIQPAAQKPFAPIPRKKGSQEVTVDNFFSLINDPYWAYNGPPPEQIFHVKESFESAEEAFAFLVKQ